MTKEEKINQALKYEEIRKNLEWDGPSNIKELIELFEYELDYVKSMKLKLCTPNADVNAVEWCSLDDVKGATKALNFAIGMLKSVDKRCSL